MRAYRMVNLYLWNMVVNIILVGALVGITAWYAHSVKKQTAIMQKEVKRPKILELSTMLYFPYRQLTAEIEHLKNKKYEWNGRSGCIKKLWLSLPGSLKLIYFKEKFPDIIRRINIHDTEVERIEKSLKRLDKLISTSSFKEKCKKLIDEFNERSKTETRHHGLHEFVYEEIPHLTRPIIDNDDKIRRTNRTYGNFWNEYRSELLKVRKKESIKEEIESLYRHTDELIEFSYNLKNDIEKRLLKYKDEYGITDEMIEGKPQVLTSIHGAK